MIVNKELATSTGHVNKDNWETPDYIFKPLDQEFKFTLDPCCNMFNAKCDINFNIIQDGLSLSWGGHRVFCNPPYSRYNIDKWVKKCYEESLKPNTIVVALLPVSTSAAWFHDWVWGKAELRFIRRRIRFIGAPHTAPFSSVIAVYKSSLL